MEDAASACDKMMVVLDKHRKLNLYSGAHKICGVHFQYSPSAQVAHIAEDIATLHLDASFALMTSSRPSSALDSKFFNDSSNLSPVSRNNVTHERILSPVTTTTSPATKPQVSIHFKMYLYGVQGGRLDNSNGASFARPIKTTLFATLQFREIIRLFDRGKVNSKSLDGNESKLLSVFPPIFSRDFPIDDN